MSIKELSLQKFLESSHLTKEVWLKAEIEFEDLKAIGMDHELNIINLDNAASSLAQILQKCPQVHSVRWRVKCPKHLLAKIVRKRSENSEKYLTINIENYTSIITDLVGIRVLHLFKSEWLNIQDHILTNWEPEEKPIAYIRKGDEEETINSYEKNNCKVEDHSAGYRSIHYVISSNPTKKVIFSEIQVRTIFEEGWSEIDHKIRYPNLSDNHLISAFLTMFNRMAGSADEMGSFVNILIEEIKDNETKYLEYLEKSAAYKKNVQLKDSKINDLLLELSKEKNDNEKNEKGSIVDSLVTEINKLSSLSPVGDFSEDSRFISELTEVSNNVFGEDFTSKIYEMTNNFLGNDFQAKLAGMSEILFADNLLPEKISDISPPKKT